MPDNERLVSNNLYKPLEKERPVLIHQLFHSDTLGKHYGIIIEAGYFNIKKRVS